MKSPKEKIREIADNIIGALIQRSTDIDEYECFICPGKLEDTPLIEVINMMTNKPVYVCPFCLMNGDRTIN